MACDRPAVVAVEAIKSLDKHAKAQAKRLQCGHGPNDGKNAVAFRYAIPAPLRSRHPCGGRGLRVRSSGRGEASLTRQATGLSGLNVGKEVPHFVFEAFRLDGERIGQRLDIGGGRTRAHGGAGDTAD